MLSLLRRSKASVDSAAKLETFLDQRSAFIAQKCAVEYCRAKAGLFWSSLFREEPFLASLAVCQWEAYAAVIIDVAVLVDAKLRAADPEAAGPVLADALTEQVRRRLDAYPRPPHRPDGWQDVIDEVARRLAQAHLSAPKQAREIGKESAKRVFEVLPIHTNLRGHDYQMVQNNIRFNLVRTAEDFERIADPSAILGEILTAAHRPAGHG